MTKKNQNSVLILATLGVYLGLVLVGGTPQVFAHAAMTRQFNVREEIELKEDLDDKPEGFAVDNKVSTASVPADSLISTSVSKFLSYFPVIHAAPAPELPAWTSEKAVSSPTPQFLRSPTRVIPLLSFVTLPQLARAGL